MEIFHIIRLQLSEKNLYLGLLGMEQGIFFIWSMSTELWIVSAALANSFKHYHPPGVAKLLQIYADQLDFLLTFFSREVSHFHNTEPLD